MQQPTGWQIAVTGGLHAFFKQAEGSSKPGTEWAVSIKGGSEEYRVLVRSYDADVAGSGQQQVISRVLKFVADRLGQGWKPSDYKGEPGELTLPAE